MFHKFTITTCAFILCLFAYTNTSAHRDNKFSTHMGFVDNGKAFDTCEAIKWKGNKNEKKNCYKTLALDLQEELHSVREHLCDFLERIDENTIRYDQCGGGSEGYK